MSLKCETCGEVKNPDGSCACNYHQMRMNGMSPAGFRISESLYDPAIRKGPPGEDDCQISKIEVEFAIPIFITGEQQHRLADLIEEIARSPKNTPVNGVHWQSELGSKPTWSQFDARFLGRSTAENAPESGEPTFDDSVLYLGTSAREDS